MSEPSLEVPDEASELPASPNATRNRWLKWIGLTILAILCGKAILDLVGRINWEAAKAGLDHIEAWQFGVLFLGLMLRQFLNAMPLAVFIPGLGPLKAAGADQGSTLISMVAPPPSDAVFRILVLRSWGISIGSATAGTTCNVIVFYIARWIAPVIGVLILLPTRWDYGYATTALICLPVALGILIGGFLVARSPRLADKLGRMLGGWVHKVRSKVDPQSWAESFVTFQGHVAARFNVGLAISVPILILYLFVDATLILAAIRFVGVDAAQLPAIEVYAAYMVLFPLTLFPFHGIGIFDAAIIAAVTAVGNVELESTLVAAMGAYRLITLGGPALLGGTFMVGWKWSNKRKGRVIPDLDDPNALT